MKAPRWLRAAALAVSAAFWVLMIAVPLAAVFGKLWGQASPSASFLDPVLLEVARFTFWQALASTVVSVFLGFALGVFHFRAGAGSAVEALLGIPFGVPAIVAAIAWVAILGRSGILARWGIPLDWAYTVKAVILAHVFFNLPWIALLTFQACGRVPREEWEAAGSLGAGFASQLRWVLWPRAKRAIAAGAAQVFAFCVMSFSIVLVLGGGPPVQTLETELYSRVRYSGLDLAGASGAAAWQLLLTLVPWILAASIGGKGGQSSPSDAPRARAPGSLRAVHAGIAGLFVLPYLAILFPLGWKALFSDPSVSAEAWNALFASLKLSVASGLFSVSFALISVIAISGFRRGGWGQRIGLSLLGVPSGISVLVLGLGFWIAYSRFVDPFEGSFAAIILLQGTLFFPFALKLLWPLAETSQRRLLEAAETLGASPLRAFWEIERPKWQRVALSAFGLAAAASLSEVGAVSLFYSEKLLPLPLLAIRWGGQYRFEEARSIASLLFVLSAGVIVFSIGGRKLGGGEKFESRWS